MTKIVLINPNKKISSPRDAARGDMGVPNPGLLCIAEYLLDNDIDVRILDLNLLKNKGDRKEIETYLASSSPDIVGVTALTCNYPSAVSIMKVVKEFDSEILTLGGGVHFSLNDTAILQSEDGEVFDIIVHGEGEQPILGVIEYYDGKKDIHDVKGVTFKDKHNKIIKTLPVKNALKPSIIRKAWKLVDIDSHKKGSKGGFGLAINTMRGCYNKCTFCSEPVRWKSISMMDAEEVVEQITYLKKHIKPDYIFMADSNFNISTERLQEFIALMKENNLFLPFISEGRADKLLEQRDLLPSLKDVGAFLLFFGGERMDNVGLKYFNKDSSTHVIEKAAKAIQDSEIGLKSTFIFGIPPDTRESIREQAKLIQQKVNPDIASFSSFTPVPGTSEYEKNKKYIRIFDLSYYTVNNTVCDTDTLHYSEIQELINFEWFSLWANELHQVKVLEHPNLEMRRFGEGYYRYLESREEYQEIISNNNNYNKLCKTNVHSK